jgi:lactobin A/cerein 7B family class IIb bacteriocin
MQPMDAQARELSDGELDHVSGGIVPALAAGIVLEAVGFLVAISAAAGDQMTIYNTTGRGDNNSCTGHQC